MPRVRLALTTPRSSGGCSNYLSYLGKMYRISYHLESSNMSHIFTHALTIYSERLPGQFRNYIKLFLRRKLVFELVDESLDIAELRLRLGTGALDLLIGVQNLFHHRPKVRRI